MALRTITSPYDLQTLTEIQAHIATYKGTTWAGIPTAQQNAYQRFIDASGEYITKRFGHEPWMIFEESISLASGTAILTLSAAVRHVLDIQETYSGDTRTPMLVTKLQYQRRFGQVGGSTDPWNNQKEPRWFLDGMTTDNPPQIQLKRAPTPDAAVTGIVMARPYLSLVSGSGDGSYGYMTANASQALLDYIFQRVELYDKNFDHAAQHKAALEDEIATTEMADNPPGGFDVGVEVGLPPTYEEELSGP